MDDIVKAAMAKWPDVPDCYGWLALDARGNWRMRDARCQALNLPGDIIRHPALINFINRNYTVDERGCWFFQNGPQRVYVDLETTPYILRTGILDMQSQTSEAFTDIDHAYIVEEGNIVFKSGHRLAQIDDRDLVEVLPYIWSGTKPADDEMLTGYLDECSNPIDLMLHYKELNMPLKKGKLQNLRQLCGIQARPRPHV